MHTAEAVIITLNAIIIHVSLELVFDDSLIAFVNSDISVDNSEVDSLIEVIALLKQSISDLNLFSSRDISSGRLSDLNFLFFANSKVKSSNAFTIYSVSLDTPTMGALGGLTSLLIVLVLFHFHH